MHEHDLSPELVSAQHVRAVIDAARDLLLDRPVDLTKPGTWESTEILVSATPLPGQSVVITVKPRQGSVALVRGASVLLYPNGRHPYPERMGVLDRRGQLKVTALEPGPHSIMLLPPWWLDDDICAEVTRGQVAWAFVQTPVMLPQLPVAEELEAAAWRKEWRSDEHRRTYRSADGLLEYAVKRNGDVLIIPALRVIDPHGRAAVCLAEVGSKAKPRVRTPSSLFDQQRPDGWWHADQMRCKRLLMLGAHAQVPPPAFGPSRIDCWFKAGLTSDSVRRRWAAAVELQAEFLEPHTQEPAGFRQT